MEYPESVLTKSKKGKIEVRSLIDRGRFVRYEYLDLRTGKRTENKVKLIIKTEKGTEEYFIIPLKQKGRFLLMLTESKPKKIWDGRKAVDLF